MAQALPLILMGINETLKSQGIESEEQTTLLDPWGKLLDMGINSYANTVLAKQQEEEYRKMGEANRRMEEKGRQQWMVKAAEREAQRKSDQEAKQEAKRLRTPAQSRKLNVVYQTAIDKALTAPALPKPIQTKVITRTTEQQVADKELQQKLKTLRAQLQPAVSTATSKRPLPPSVSLKGNGATQLLFRVMNEFNMNKTEAKKYIKKHGSN